MREEILKLLENGKPLDMLEISKKLGYTREMDNVLAKTLTEMVNNYDLHLTNKKRYMLFKDNEKNDKYFKGKFMDTNSDYGFVRVEGLTDDIFVHGSKTNGALNGDEVLVYVTKNAKGEKKTEGEIVKILNREVNNKVGEIYHYDGKIMVSLNDKKLKKLIYLDSTPETRRLVDGDKVFVSFEGSRQDNDYIKAKFIKRIGHKDDPDIEIQSTLVEHGIEEEYSDEYLEELSKMPTEVRPKDTEGRRDLRKLLTVTIDGADTKDIDDAISIEILPNGNIKLYVHIADVSYYVKENSVIDLVARERGNSTYADDSVCPMIHHQLSNGICSLWPDKDRLTITCEMEIDSNGKLVNSDIYESVINSSKKMTYEEVNQILDKDTVPEGYEPYADTLRKMNDLAHIIRKERESRGSIDFDTREPKIIRDDNRKPIGVTYRDTGSGQRLIEDFMVRANETVATTVCYMDLPFLYRIHGMPDAERLDKFMKILSGLGISINADLSNISPKTIQTIVKELKKHREFRVLATKLLSCMDKAVYSPENIGHFALAIMMYTHFTSPIRRYSDLMVHRMLRKYLFSKDGYSQENIEHFEQILGDIAVHISETERNSEDAEREADESRIAEVMENHIGEEFIGFVSGVTNYGIFVLLDSNDENVNAAEGLIPYDSFGCDFQYDRELEIVKIGNNVFKLGKEIRVRVERASKEAKEIDFGYVGDVDEEKIETKTR